ncbi:hypothetical protein ABE073_04550 [Lederbergia citrisecunda]|uniref:hypothetical protein n=1 Tax=Lederbergia citrisecunda TaxID=2833583 RepID=UPI003D2D40A2
MIKKINSKIRRSNNGGIFHDSRQDVATLTRVCNELIDKVNELTDKVNELSSKD